MLWVHFWDAHGVLEGLGAHFGDLWSQFEDLWTDIWDSWELLGVVLGFIGIIFRGLGLPICRKCAFAGHSKNL